MKVKVNIVRIGEYDVNVKDDDTLHDLRKKVSKIVKESKHSRIFFHDVILSGDDTLVSYNITDGSKLEFVPCVDSNKKKDKKKEEKLIPTNTPPKIVTFHSMEEKKNPEELPSDKERKEIQDKLEKFREELRRRKEEKPANEYVEVPPVPTEDYVEKLKEETYKPDPSDYVEEPKEETYKPDPSDYVEKQYFRPPIPAVMVRLTDPIDVPKDYVEEKKLTDEQLDAVAIIMSLLPPHRFTEKYVKFMYENCNFDAESTANVLLGQ